MKLYNATMRPGRVLEVLSMGQIRVDAPGLFSEQDKDALPPVMPWFQGGTNACSSINEGDSVWILSLDDNPQQLYWFRKDQREINGEFEDMTNVEVICNKDAGLGYASIYFSDGTGWVFRNGESAITITDDEITLKAGGSYLKVGAGGVKYGSDIDISGGEGADSDEESEKVAMHATYAEPVMDALSAITRCLDSIKQAALKNVYTLPIGMAIGNTPGMLTETAHEIVCHPLTLPD